MKRSLRRVKYQPIPVKDILKRMKNISSVMVDLAYYSAIYGDETLANEILKFGDQIDMLEYLLMMEAAIATRDVSDAEKIVSIFVFSSSVGKISDAAEEIASTKLSLKIPLRWAGTDMVCRTTVSRDSWANGRTLGELFKRLRRVINVLLVKRSDKWILEPDAKFRLNEGDVLFTVGLIGNLGKFREAIGDLPDVMHEEIPAVYRSLTESLVQLLNFSDFIVDLAYISMLTSSEEVAHYVIEIEQYIDTMLPKIERQILSTSELSANDKVGLLKIIEETERISDAARKMAEIILLGLEPHPIIADVLLESEERIRVVPAEDEEDGKHIKDLGYEDYGAIVLAVKSKKKWYIRAPGSLKLRKGDILILKYLSEARELEFPEEMREREEVEEAVEALREEEMKEAGTSAHQ